jgi:tetratricopeptide (TPR) repeat protein
MKDSQFLFKAYLRRAAAREKRGKYLDAIRDVDEALLLNPGHKEAMQLRSEAQKKYAESEGENVCSDKSKPKTKKPIVIEEVDEADEEMEEIMTPMFKANYDSLPNFTKQPQQQRQSYSSKTSLKGKERATAIEIPPPPPISAEDEEECEARKDAVFNALREEMAARARRTPGAGCSSGVKLDDKEIAELKKSSPEYPKTSSSISVNTEIATAAENTAPLKTPLKSAIAVVDVEDDSDEEMIESYQKPVDSVQSATQVANFDTTVEEPNQEKELAVLADSSFVEASQKVAPRTAVSLPLPMKQTEKMPPVKPSNRPEPQTVSAKVSLHIDRFLIQLLVNSSC